MGELELERVCVESHARGFVRGREDRAASPFPNPAPLSGEWSGESVRELLGDLVVDVIRFGRLNADPLDAVCDAYESGYADGFGPVPETLSVCPDCFDWFASFAGATESPDREMPAGVAYWDNPARFVIEWAGESDCFSWAGCDTCRTTLGGPRYAVAVFDSGEDSADNEEEERRAVERAKTLFLQDSRAVGRRDASRAFRENLARIRREAGRG